MSASVITDVVEIIEKMLEIIPSEEKQLINDLQIYNSTLWNKAPEVRCRDCWIPLTSILRNNDQAGDQPWKTEIIKLFNDGKTEVERLLLLENSN